MFALASGVGAESPQKSNFAYHEDSAMAENRKRKFWGWGYEDQGPTPEQQKHMAERMAKRFGIGPLELTPPPKESARSDLLDSYTRARGAYVWQGIARYPASVPARLSESDRRGRVSAR